jgi:hypothetical protein
MFLNGRNSKFPVSLYLLHAFGGWRFSEATDLGVLPGLSLDRGWACGGLKFTLASMNFATKQPLAGFRISDFMM